MIDKKNMIRSLSSARILRYIFDFLLFLFYFFHEVASVKDVHFSNSCPSPSGRHHRHCRHHCHRHRPLIYVRVPKVLLLLCVVRGGLLLIEFSGACRAAICPGLLDFIEPLIYTPRFNSISGRVGANRVRNSPGET